MKINRYHLYTMWVIPSIDFLYSFFVSIKISYGNLLNTNIHFMRAGRKYEFPKSLNEHWYS